MSDRRDRRQYFADYYRRNKPRKDAANRPACRAYRARHRWAIRVRDGLGVPIAVARELIAREEQRRE